MTLALIERARGIRGEVSADAFGAAPERFENLTSGLLFSPGDPEGRPVEVESAWVHKGRMILKFRGIDTMSDAELLRGSELRIPAEDRPPAPEGEYYHSDLFDCEVVDRSGRVIGRVTGWQDFGGSGLLQVQGAGGREILVPFAKAICVDIDIARKRITVELPEGLEDLS